jgi:hypothetical protein
MCVCVYVIMHVCLFVCSNVVYPGKVPAGSETGGQDGPHSRSTPIACERHLVFTEFYNDKWDK